MGSMNGATYTATQSGNWNSSSTWGGAGTPTAADNVIINQAFTITLTANAACTNLENSNTGRIAMGIYNLSASGNLTFNCNSGTFTTTTGYLILNGTTQTINLCTGGGNSIPNLRLTNSTAVSMIPQTSLTITGNFDCQTGSSTFTNNNAAGWQSGSFIITGSCTAPNCTFIAGTNINGTSMDFSSCSSPIQVGGVNDNMSTAVITFGNKTVVSLSHFTGSYTSNIIATGTVTYILKQFQSKQNGNWSDIATWNQSIDNGVTWNAATTTPTSSDGLVAILNGNTVTLTGNAGASNLNIISGTLDVGTNTLTGSGSGTLTVASSGTLIVGGTTNFPTGFTTTLSTGSTVNYDNNGAQTVSAQSYSNLTLSGSGAKTLPTGTTTIGGNLTLSGTATTATVVGLTISGNLNIGNGTTFTVAGFAFTVSGTTTVGGGTSGVLNVTSATGAKLLKGLVTVAAGATWNNSGNSGVEFQGGITNSGTFTSGSGIYTFDTNNQALTGTLSIPTITVTGVTLTNNNILTVGTALSGTGGVTQATNATLNIGGTSSISGSSNLTASGNTVNYTGATQTVISTNFYNLTLSGSGTDVLQTGTTAIGGNMTLSGSVTTSTVAGLAINGNLLIGNGTIFNAAGYALTVTGTTTVGGGTNGTLNITSNTGTILFTGLVTIAAGATWNNSGNSAVELRGGITNSGTFTSGSGIYTFDTNNQALTGTLSIPTITVTGVTLTNNNILTVGTALSGTGGVTQATNATLNIGGTSSISGSSNLTASGNTVNYTGATQTVISTNFYNLTLSGSGTDVLQTGTTAIGGNMTLSGSVTTSTVAGLAINGNLLIGNGTIFNAAGYALTVTGTTTVGGGTNGTLNITSNTGTILFTGLVTIAAGATWNNSGNSAVEFRGGITNSGTFTAGSGIYTFDTNNQALTGTFSIPTITVTGVTLTNNNILTVGTALSGTGGVTQATNATLNIGGTSSISGSSILTASGNTVNFTGSSQTVISTNYYNLTLSGSGTDVLQTGTTAIGGNFVLNGSVSTTAVSALTIGGNVDLESNNFFTNGAFTHNVGGNWINNGWGATYTPGTGTINFTGNSSTITGTNATQNFNNIIISKTAGQTVSFGGSSTTLTVAGTFTETTGNFTAPATTTVTGDLTLTSGTFTAGTNLTVSGNWNNNGGTFTPGTGTVTMNGIGKYIQGSAATTFKGLTIGTGNSATIILGIDQTTVNGTLTLTNGLLTLGAYNLILGVSAPAVSASSFYSANMIVADGTGQVRKLFTPGSYATSYTFPIGDSSPNYSPITLNFTQGTYAGSAYAAVNVKNTKHTYNTSPVNYLRRYWTVSQSGITSFLCNVSGTYVYTPDVAGQENLSTAVEYTGSLPWLNYSPLGSNTLTANGVSVFGDFTGMGLPSLSTTTTSLTGFTVVHGAGASASQQFNLNGTNLSSPLLVTPSADFEVSLDNISYQSSTPLTVPQSNGVVSQTVYVRIKAGTPIGTYTNENIVCSSIGATSITVTASGTVTQAIYYSIATGNWNNNTTWSYYSGSTTPVASGVFPQAGDIVVIERGYTVTVNNSTAACTTLTVGSPGNYLSGALTFSGTTPTLTVSGALQVGGYGSTDRTGTILFISGSTLNAGSIILGNAAGTPAAGIINMTAGGTLITGSLAVNTVTGNTWTPGSGTVIMNTTNTLPATIFTTFNNLTCSGGITTTGTGLTINGNLNIGDGSIFNIGGYNFTVGGTTTVGGGVSGNLNFSSATGAKLFTGLVTISNGATWTNNSNSPVEYRGGITIAPTYTYMFSGGSGTQSFTTNNQALTCKNDGVEYVSTFFNFPSMTVSAGTTVTNNDALLVGNISGLGGLTQGINSIFYIQSASTISTLTATAVGNTVNYYGTAQTVLPITYNNLTLTGTGTKTLTGVSTINGNLEFSPYYGNATATAATGLTIGGNVILQAGTFSGSNFTHNVAGNWINNGGTFINTGSTINFNGTTAQTIGGSASTTFNNISIANTAAAGNNTVTLNMPASVSVILNLTSGILVTTPTNMLSVTNPASAAITGGSVNSYINGPVVWTLPASLATGTTYNFPVGNTTYLPFSLVNPTTGTAPITAQVQATSGNSGGTPGSLTSLSTTEYWSLATTGNFTNSSVSVSRPATPISPLNVIGGSTTLGGTYTSLGGTFGSNGVSASASIGTNRFFVLAQTTRTSIWLKADAGTGTTTDGNSVSTWNDQSGIANNATPGPGNITTPNYQAIGSNFNPTINFSNGYYLTASNQIADDMTFFAVYNSTQSTGNSNPLLTPAIIGGETVRISNDYSLSTNNGNLSFKGTTGTGFDAQTPGTYNDGIAKIVSVTRQKAGNITLYVNGTQAATATSDGTSLNGSTQSGIGNQVSYNSSAQFVGNISEVYGNNSVYSTTARQNFESYLGLKYGVTLSNNYTNGSGTTVYAITGYANDIAGLGYDATYGLNQKVSSSVNTASGSKIVMATTNDFVSGNMAPGRTTSLTGGQYLVWGHNGGSTNAWINNGSYLAVNRVWKAQNTGTVGAVSFQIDLSGYPAPGSGIYTLLVDNDGNFSNGGTTEYPLTNSSGSLYTTSCTFPGTSYFTIAGSKTPIITITNPTALNDFSYPVGYGPSTQLRYFTVSGTNLTTNITVLPTDSFDISLTSGASFIPQSLITLQVNNGTVAATNVYVQMKAGFALGSIVPKLPITCTSDNATTQNILCSGTVTVAPVITVTQPSTVFNYTIASGGPSPSQSFTVYGTNLTNDIVITPPTDYLICSTSGGTYTSTPITLTESGGNVGSITTPIPIYVKLKGTLQGGIYNENIVVTSNTSSTPVTQNVVCIGSVGSPMINVSTFALGGFIYSLGAGSSGVQSFTVSGSTLPVNLVLTPPTGFEISLSPTSGFGSAAISLTPDANGTVATTIIYVHMKAGLAVGTVGPVNLTAACTNGAAIQQNIAFSGKVVSAGTAASISSNNTLTGFVYPLNYGPSVIQSFTVSGTSLNADITVTPTTTNFEISLSTDTTTFVTTALTIHQSGGLVNAVPVYVRLKKGLSIGSYLPATNFIKLTAAEQDVSCSGIVIAAPTITAGATPSTSVCANTTVTLTSSGTGLLNIYWTGPNSFYSTLPSPGLGAVTAANAGSYTVTGSAFSGVNMLTNGDFDLLNTGFGSSYGYVASGSQVLANGGPYSSNHGEGLYSITNGSATVLNSHFTGVTAESGSYQMVVNGAESNGIIAWSESVSVAPGANYQFSYWVDDVGQENLSILQLYVNGLPAGGITTAGYGWKQFVYNVSSGTNTVLQLALINENTATGGNDFALDNVVFQQAFPISATVNLTVSTPAAVSVSITASTNPIYSNAPVTFTATPVNGGTTPTYQWQKNATPISGATSSTYTYTPVTGDIITCVLTSNYSCATGNPATSNQLTVLKRTNFWMGSTGTKGNDWGTISNWTGNAIPAPGLDVVYASSTNDWGHDAVNNLLLDQNRTIGSLVNATTMALFIPAGLGLIVNNTITTDGIPSRIFIKSSSTGPNGSLIFNNPSGSPVNASVEMYSLAFYNPNGAINNKYTWQYFGIPISTMTANPTLFGSYVRSWDETGTSITNHWVSLNNYSVLSPFLGYEITQQNPVTILFQGQLVNSNYNSGQLSVTSNALYPGQHIFANPYTAAIDIRQLTFGSDTEASVYLYNSGTYNQWQNDSIQHTTLGTSAGQYTAIPKNTAGNSGLPRQVPSMQAFLVKVMTPTSTVNSTFGITYNSVVMYNTDKQRVKGDKEVSVTDSLIGTSIELDGTSNSDRMWLFAQPGCTRNFDNGWDGAKMPGDALAPKIFAEEEDGNYQVDAVDDINNTFLGFQAGEDTQYKLTFTHQNITSKYAGVYLVDLVDNKTVDITLSGSTYSFTAESTPTPVKRFIIATRSIDNTGSGDNSQLKVFNSGNTVFVQNLSNQNGQLNLYDMMGRNLKNAKFGPYGISAIQIGSFISGAYIINAATDNERVCKKIIIGQ